MSIQGLLEEIIINKYTSGFSEKILKMYFTFEFCFLSNNISLNPNKFDKHSYIELSTLESYFPYPMILTRSIFKAFDTQNKQYITKDEYVSNFMTLFNGSINERIKLIFHIFNINDDNFIYLEDVICILNYCHIFCNKENINILNETISSFFGKHKLFTQEDFINRTFSKSPGLFLIILSILIENKTFSHEILSFMEDNEKYNALGFSIVNNNTNVNNSSVMDGSCLSTIKKRSSKFKISSNRQMTSIYYPKKDAKLYGMSTIYNKTPLLNKSNTNYTKLHTSKNLILESNIHTGTTSMINEDVIKYIVINFQIELNNLEMSSIYQNDNINNKLEQINANDSLEYTEECFPTRESDDELECLYQFDIDMEEVKIELLEQHFLLTEFNVPKGSNDFEIQSGVIHSRLTSKTNSSGLQTGSFNYLQFNKKRNNDGMSPPKDSARGCSSFQREKKTHSSILLANLENNKNNNNNNNNNNNSAINASFSYGSNNPRSDISNCQSDLINSNNNLNMSNLIPYDHFEEDIYISKKPKDKLKKYTMVLIRGYLMLIKKKANGNNNSPQKEEVNTLGSNDCLNDYKVIGIKMFIPTKKLFIGSVNNNYKIGDREFIQVILISTVCFKRKTYKFLIQNKSTVNAFVKIFCHITNYINIENEYCYVKDVGKGSFCQMKLMRHIQSNLLYAVKKIRKDVHTLQEFTALNWERDIITFLKSFPNIENILKCYDILETAENLYIITEFIEGGSLSSYIRKNKICLPSSIVKEFIFQIAKGLNELHNYGIVHRDMKLENVLIDCKDENSFTVKIIDFGLSQVITPLSKTKETYGTLVYCSPEILLNIPYNNQVDVWSLGIIAYYLEFTFMPFNIRGRESEQEISQKIITNNLHFPKKIDSTNNPNESQANKIITTLIRQCLTKDFNQRITSKQLILYLKNH